MPPKYLSGHLGFSQPPKRYFFPGNLGEPRWLHENEEKITQIKPASAKVFFSSSVLVALMPTGTMTTLALRSTLQHEPLSRLRNGDKLKSKVEGREKIRVAT